MIIVIGKDTILEQLIVRVMYQNTIPFVLFTLQERCLTGQNGRLPTTAQLYLITVSFVFCRIWAISVIHFRNVLY